MSRLSRRAALLSLMAAAAVSAGARDRGEWITSIAPGLSIVTEVSQAQPYVGEQFSIVYWLRAQTPPAAIDIVAQQYSGLWAQVVPLEESHAVDRERYGRTSYESLLRQVVAYPLRDGTVELPPLALRIRTSDDSAANARGWDLEGSSRPITLEVLKQPGAGAPLVAGSLAGRAEPSGAREITLELSGTANLSFLDPVALVRFDGAEAGPRRLAEATDRVETRDLEGVRTVRIVHRYTWRLALRSDASGEVRVGDVIVPVFDPESAARSEFRIPGFTLPATGAPERKTRTPAPRTAFFPGVALAAVVCVLAAAALLVLWRVRARVG